MAKHKSDQLSLAELQALGLAPATPPPPPKVVAKQAPVKAPVVKPTAVKPAPTKPAPKVEPPKPAEDQDLEYPPDHPLMLAAAWICKASDKEGTGEISASFPTATGTIRVGREARVAYEVLRLFSINSHAAKLKAEAMRINQPNKK